MKEALEKRDEELASAWKEANQKTKAVDAKLKSVEKLEEEKQLLEVGAKKSFEEVVEMKKQYVEWESKFEQVTAKKLELEQFVEDFDK